MITKDCWAFPNTDITDGEIVSFHCRLSPKDKATKAKWVYDPSGTTIHPLVRGDTETALFIAIGESQWDLFTLEDKLGDEARNWAFIATRGATGTKSLSKLSLPTSSDIYLFPQNDPAGQKWLESAVEQLDRSVRVVTLDKHKDLNEWGKNGLDADTLRQAIDGATVQLAPEKSIPKRKPRVTEKEANKLEADALPVAQALDAYYDQERKEYVIKIEGERTYQVHTEAQFKRDLRFQGLTEKAIPYHTYSQIDIVLRFLQQKRFVHYAGALAGKECGYYFENGVRILVTSEPRIIAPAKGGWTTLNSFLTNLLCGPDEPHGEDQLTVLYGWLKIAYTALCDHRFQPGQALAIAGPVESGKSLLQDLITQILGGRAAKAAMFLQGRTDFNGELFTAEHLLLEDESASTSYPARAALGVNIKGITANRVQASHAKYRQIVNLAPWWR
jgi:hypothetical protein